MAMDEDFFAVLAFFGEHGAYCVRTDETPISVDLALPQMFHKGHTALWMLRRYSEELEILFNRRDEGLPTIEV
jgi:hypothetical protein